MRWVDWKLRTLAFLVVVPVALLGGCGDDKSSNEDTTQNVSQETAVQTAVAAVEFIDVFVNSIGNVMAGDLTGGFAAVRPPSSVPGDLSRDDLCLSQEPTCQEEWTGTAWTASCSSTSTDCSISAAVFVQFLDATGAPQQEPDASTEEFTYNVDMTIDFLVMMTPGRVADFLDYFFDFNNDMTVRDLQEAVYSAQGAGSMEFEISGEQDGTAFAEAASISWSYDLAVPALGGCATGTVQITVGQYTAVGVYGSDGRYTVTVYLNGEQVHFEEGFASCA